MKILNLFSFLVLGPSVMLGVDSAGVLAQETQDPDWPCEQILVPEVPAAVVWAGPSIEGFEGAWQKVGSVNGLVRRITPPGYDQNAADHEIKQFAQLQKPQQKELMLTLLFAGVLDVLNSERSRMLSGIMRYSRGQSERANRLGNDLDEMARLEEDSSEGSRIRLESLRKQMLLKQRIFDEREESIQHLCSRPVAVEQRLGFLARSIASYLD